MGKGKKQNSTKKVTFLVVIQENRPNIVQSRQAGVKEVGMHGLAFVDE